MVSWDGRVTDGGVLSLLSAESHLPPPHAFSARRKKRQGQSQRGPNARQESKKAGRRGRKEERWEVNSAPEGRRNRAAIASE